MLLSIVHIEVGVIVPSAKTFGTLDNIATTKANTKINTNVFPKPGIYI